MSHNAIENRMVLPEAAPNEPPEPNRHEIEEAEREVFADLLQVTGAATIYHQDGRTLVDESWRESDLAATFLRDLTVTLRQGYVGTPDDAEIGRMLRRYVEHYIRQLAEFDWRVDERIALKRRESRELARADADY